MLKGISVANFSIGKSGVTNAAIFAAQIIGTSDADMSAKLDEYKIKMHDDVLKANESIQ
jgi:5-(carboxyamino)imidazole ribonucleotide mutase